MKKYRVIIGSTFVLWAILLGIVVHDNKELFLERYRALNRVPVVILDFDIVLHEVPAGTQRGSFYFDTGRGFNPAEVVVFSYSQPAGETAKHYSISLPTKRKIFRLRFDPLDGPGKISIANFQVRKKTTKKISFVQKELEATKNHSISTIKVNGSTLTITSVGGDPHFVLLNDFLSYQ